MVYRTWATNDIPSAADFNNLFSDPVQQEVATAETTTSTSYTDLTTSGPAVTNLAMVNGQTALVIVSAKCDNDAATSTTGAKMGFAVSGATTLAASDPNAAENNAAGQRTVTRASVVTATATGNHTFTAKYKRTGASGTATFLDRRIIVRKF